MPSVRKKLLWYKECSPTARALDVLGDRWTLLIIRILTGGPVRFTEIQRRLPGISTEQLRTRLNQMTEYGLLRRERFREVPPRVDYELTDRGRSALKVVSALTEWGEQWASGPLLEDESVSVESLLLDKVAMKSIPGTMSAMRLRNNDRSLGQVLLEVISSGSTRHYLISVLDGVVEFINTDGYPSSAENVISGTHAQWVRLLLDGNSGGLVVTGRNSHKLLDMFFTIDEEALAA